jgi:signal transduction histidine kinase
MARARHRTEILIAAVPIGLAVATFAVLFAPSASLAVVNPSLALVIDAVASLVAVAVAILGWVRYREGQDESALRRASALLVLGTMSGLFIMATVFGLDRGFGLSLDEPSQLPLWAMVLARALAAFLLITAGLVAVGQWRGIRRPLLAFWLPSILGLGMVVLATGVQRSLPHLVSPRALEILRVDPSAPLMAGEAPLLIAIEAILAVAFLAAAALSYRAYARGGRGTDAVLAVALVVAAFSQVLFAIHPGTYSSIVTFGDLLRITFYAIMLAVLAVEVRGDIRALREANEELTRLRESEVLRATAEERAHLAREIHDGMSQELWYAKLKQGRLLALPQVEGDARELASEVATAIESALAEARQAILTLRPVEGATFAEVVERYVADFSDRFGVAAECQCAAAADILSARTKAELLRIVQEALANVRKHADATRVRVELTVGDGSLRLRVSDNGRGFALEQPARGGYGLKSMQQRTAVIGGTLAIESRPQDGTSVTVLVPLPAAAG